MRYRRLSPSGDYTFGQGVAEILANVPEAVAQAVTTRLLLATGEWFLDVSDGTPYNPDVLGFGTQTLYDQALQDRILNTQGVLSIDQYSSTLNTTTRRLTVEATITTIYGAATIAVAGAFGS